MIRNLLTLAVVAALVYGAYQINEKYFSGSAAKEKTAALTVNKANMSPLVCPRDVDAFDPAAPDKQIGMFTKGTEVLVAPHSGTPGMKNVVYQQPDGQIVEALCREKDLTEPEIGAPLAQMERKSVIPDNPELKKDADRSWLGNGQMTIQQGNNGGCSGGGAVIKMGQSGAKKTMSDTFKNQQLNPMPTPSQEYSIKQKAKDLNSGQQCPPSP